MLSAKKIAVTSLVFAIIAIGLIMVGQRPSAPGPTKTTISEILVNPATWENRLVEVEGIIDGAITIPEIKLPFNYWLIDEANKTNRIGVLWTREETLCAGEHALITGTVKSGYEKRLTADRWVNSVLVYIEAQAVAE